MPWLVLIDLDHDAECAPPYVEALVPSRPGTLCLRVAVRAVETWLLADRGTFAEFLGVRPQRLPLEPEREADPASCVVAAARRSRRRAIRDGLPPRPGSGRKRGPEYVPLLEEFIRSSWSPTAAATRSPSLAGAIRCVQRLSAA